MKPTELNKIFYLMEFYNIEEYSYEGVIIKRKSKELLEHKTKIAREDKHQQHAFEIIKKPKLARLK